MQTADRRDEPLRDAVKTTFVVTKAEMVRRGDETVADALARVPGVNLQRNGPLGTISELTHRRLPHHADSVPDRRPARRCRRDRVQRSDRHDADGRRATHRGRRRRRRDAVRNRRARRRRQHHHRRCGRRPAPAPAYLVRRRFARRTRLLVRERDVLVRAALRREPLRLSGDRAGRGGHDAQRRLRLDRRAIRNARAARRARRRTRCGPALGSSRRSRRRRVLAAFVDRAREHDDR